MYVIYSGLIQVGIFILEKYTLLPILCSGGIMRNEIDNKRQDVGNGNSLHPYAGDVTSHTAYYAPNQV